MKDSIQDEADEVAEVLGVESAAWCPAHVVANSQRNLSDLRVAVVAANKTKTHLTHVTSHQQIQLKRT